MREKWVPPVKAAPAPAKQARQSQGRPKRRASDAAS
jgi:hypothetical protein